MTPKTCIFCGTIALDGLCSACKKSTAQKVTIVGSRDSFLKELIDDYKFHRKKAASQVLARLLGDAITSLPTPSIIVPIPTSQPHIRQRGYDHIALITKYLVKHLEVPAASLLHRQHDQAQVGVSRKQRALQAKTAFSIKERCNPKTTYILIDDVITTGATLHAAAQQLRIAGAKTIHVAALARQTLDE